MSRTRLLALCLAGLVACLGGRKKDAAGERAPGDRPAPSARGAGSRERAPNTGSKAEAPDTPEEEGVKPEGGRPPVPASPEALLAPGAVKEIQQALADRGYLPGRFTEGELDDATSAGIRRFQEDEGLAATGMADRETLRRLGVEATEAYGRE